MPSISRMFCCWKDDALPDVVTQRSSPSSHLNYDLKEDSATPMNFSGSIPISPSGASGPVNSPFGSLSPRKVKQTTNNKVSHVAQRALHTHPPTRGFRMLRPGSKLSKSC